MRKRQFDIGDCVRIRQWDDMAEQYGVCGDEIECEFSFTEDMQKDGLCGKEFVITDISSGGYIYGHNTHWSISEDMLELVEEDTVRDTKEMEEFLNTILVRG